MDHLQLILLIRTPHDQLACLHNLSKSQCEEKKKKKHIHKISLVRFIQTGALVHATHNDIRSLDASIRACPIQRAEPRHRRKPKHHFKDAFMYFAKTNK